MDAITHIEKRVIADLNQDTKSFQINEYLDLWSGPKNNEGGAGENWIESKQYPWYWTQAIFHETTEPNRIGQTNRSSNKTA